MNARQLYRFARVDRYQDFGPWVESHVPEIDSECRESLPNLDEMPNPRVQVRTVADPYIDGTRCWTLQTIWFRARDVFEPIMICQRAGRSDRDFKARYVTDLTGYREMVDYLRDISVMNVSDLVDPEADIPGLTDFYSHTLESALDAEVQQALARLARAGCDRECGLAFHMTGGRLTGGRHRTDCAIYPAEDAVEEARFRRMHYPTGTKETP